MSRGRGAAKQRELELRPRIPGPQAVAGLFAGIGGLELGLHRAGHQTTLLCEIDEAAQAVLAARFANVRREADVRALERLPEHTTLLAAGFPCQDLSQAGQTTGITGARSGLVTEVFRLLEARPLPWVLLENVPFMLRLGRGQALRVIVEALEGLGYRWAYRVVDSRAFGLPQRRQRVFLLAAREEDPRAVLFADDAGPPEEEPDYRKVACGFYWTEGIRGLGWAVDAVPTLKGGSTVGIPSPPAILFPDGRVAKPDLRDAERLQGFEADWTRPAEAVARSGFRWKLVGNAVTVRTAEWLGGRLASPGVYDGGDDSPLVSGAPWPTAAWNLGEGRFASRVSAWPERRPALPLERFLEHPTQPLSEKATRGFRERTTRSSLRFPAGFLEALDRYLEGLERAAPRAARSSR